MTLTCELKIKHKTFSIFLIKSFNVKVNCEGLKFVYCESK